MIRLRAAAAVGAWLTAAVIVVLLSGMSRWAWAWVPLGALFLVVPSQIAWQLTERHRRVAVPVAVALTAGLAAGLVTYAVTPLSAAELRAVERRFVVPASWTKGVVAEHGGPLCRERCPTVTWRWHVDDRASVAAVDAVAVLRSAGFRVVVSEDDGRAVLAATNGRVKADAVVAEVSRPGGGRRESTVRLALTSRPATL